MAPPFTGKDQEGKSVSLKDFRGKKVILYFYPKDDTPGCTAEACNLRDNYDDLLNRGFAILGVSPDDEKSHVKFRTKYVTVLSARFCHHRHPPHLPPQPHPEKQNSAVLKSIEARWIGND